MKVLKGILAGSLIGFALFVFTLVFPNISFAEPESFPATCIIEIRTDTSIEHFEYVSERITADLVEQQCWDAAVNLKLSDSVISLVKWEVSSGI